MDLKAKDRYFIHNQFDIGKERYDWHHEDVGCTYLKHDFEP
jgi:hypothetical protein